MRIAALIILAALAYLGSNQFVYPLPIGIAVFPFRVMLPIAVVVHLITRQWGLPNPNRLVHRFYAFIVAWIVYGGLLVFFAFNMDKAFHYWLFLITNLIFVYLVSAMITSVRDLTLYAKACVVILVGLLLLATWEHLTENHLLLSAFNRATAKPGMIARMYYSTRAEHLSWASIPTGTFSNPNDFAYALVLLVPLAIGWLISSRRIIVRIALVCVVLWTVFIIAVTQSRAALFSLLFVIIPICMVFGITNHRTRISIVVGLVLFALLVPISMAMSPELANKVQYRVEDALSALDPDYLMENPRLALTINAGRLLLRSFGIGVGPKQTVALMHVEEGLLPTGHLTSVHNMWAELLSDYGLPVFISFVAFFFLMTRTLWRLRKHGDSRITSHALVGLAMLFGMIPAALSPSGGIYLIPTFATLGYVLAVIKIGYAEQGLYGELGLSSLQLDDGAAFYRSEDTAVPTSPTDETVY